MQVKVPSTDEKRWVKFFKEKSCGQFRYPKPENSLNYHRKILLSKVLSIIFKSIIALIHENETKRKECKNMPSECSQ